MLTTQARLAKKNNQPVNLVEVQLTVGIFISPKIVIYS